MLHIDHQGAVMDDRITRMLCPMIERGRLSSVSGLIVHQTGAATAQSSLNSYRQQSAHGAHFLIDRDGTIYQTASVHKQTWHVGKLKSRCMLEARCSAAETQLNRSFNPSNENARELRKAVPDRFPSNADSLGIELVGQVAADPSSGASQATYESVTQAQNSSLHWLVAELSITMNIPLTEVFRHPTVSRKNPSEASTARW